MDLMIKHETKGVYRLDMSRVEFFRIAVTDNQITVIERYCDSCMISLKIRPNKEMKI